MLLSTLRSVTALSMVCVLPASMLGAETLGTIVSDGQFRINRSVVSGSATLFDGALVETEATPSRMEFRGGWMLLGSDTQVRLGRSLVALERGVGELGSAGKMSLTARTLRVVPSGEQTAARVKLDGDNRVIVAAVHGPVNVFNSTGTLVAKVRSGAALAFTPQAAGPEKYDVSGCLLWKDTGFILIDANGIKVAVVGGDPAKTAELARATGNRVRITGNSTGQTTGGLATVTVDTLTDVAPGGCLAVARSESASVTAPSQMAAAAPKPEVTPAKAARPANAEKAPRVEKPKVETAKVETPKVEKVEKPKKEKKEKAKAVPPPPQPESTPQPKTASSGNHNTAIIAGVAVAAAAGVGIALGMSGKKNTSD